MMIDINNSTSLPETDKEALAAREGVTVRDFAGVGLRMGRRSWQQHYESLLVDPYVYYQDNFSAEPIFRYLQTHPDMDHMSGLHRFFWLEKVPLINFWDVPHGKELDEDSFAHGPYNYQDWLTYLQLRAGRGPKGSDGTPASHHVIKNTRLDSGQFWTDDGIQVFSPTPDLIADCDDSEEFNDCSYVIKLSYGGRSLILPGDAEEPAWKSMLAALGPSALSCDILKAAHHGRDSGFYQPAVEAMNPSGPVHPLQRHDRSPGLGRRRGLGRRPQRQAPAHPPAAGAVRIDMAVPNILTGPGRVLDAYSIRARWGPVVLAVLPPLLLAFSLLPGLPGWNRLWPLAGAAAVVILVEQLGRDGGKRLQPSLWDSWGGAPTTAALRHCEVPNPILLARQHERVAAVLGHALPTAEEELADPTGADHAYQSTAFDSRSPSSQAAVSRHASAATRCIIDTILLEQR